MGGAYAHSRSCPNSSLILTLNLKGTCYASRTLAASERAYCYPATPRVRRDFGGRPSNTAGCAGVGAGGSMRRAVPEGRMANGTLSDFFVGGAYLGLDIHLLACKTGNVHLVPESGPGHSGAAIHPSGGNWFFRPQILVFCLPPIHRQREVQRSRR